MTNIFERIVKFADYKGFRSLNEFAIKGLKYKSSEKLNRLKDGSKKPSFDIIEDITNKFEDINIRWLVSGQGSMFNYNDILNEPKPAYVPESKQLLPLYDIKQFNSLGDLFKNSGKILPVDHIAIPQLHKAEGAIKMTNNNMYPLLKPGDIIIYKQVGNIKQDIFWGEMYLLAVSTGADDFITVSYILSSDKGDDWVKLSSYNPDNEDMHVLRSRIKYLAVVKGGVWYNSL